MDRDEILSNIQTSPTPDALIDLVGRLSYRPGWSFTIAWEDRGQECEGLTFTVHTATVNSNPPHDYVGVRHLFPVPPASYNRQNWQRWLFDRLAEVELHECMEFFKVDGARPYAPCHAPGFDPYVVTQMTTQQALETDYLGRRRVNK